MVFVNGKLNFNFSLLFLALIIVLSSCGKEPPQVEASVVDPWICDLKSIDDGSYYYDLGIGDNDENIAVSDERIIRVGKDGFLVSNTGFTLSEEERTDVKIFDGQIYRFVDSNEFYNFDPNKKVLVEVYDTSGGLITTHTLATNGLMYDVEMESSEVVGLMVYNPDQFTMTLKKFNFNNGLMAEVQLNDLGSAPHNLTIAENGDYFCNNSGAAKSLFHFDNNLNLKLQKDFSEIFIQRVKQMPGHGVFIMGPNSLTNFSDVSVALLDENGVIQNKIDIAVDSTRTISNFQMNDEVMCIITVEPESNRNLQLMFFDLDFNPISTIDIPGNVIFSDLILNDLGSFTFLYGIQTDPNSTEFFPESNPRIFKFDKSYTLPTNVIEQ